MIETIKVKRDGPKGYHIINKADFDPKTMEAYEPEAVTEKPVAKKGRK